MDANTLYIYIDGSAITNPGSVVGCAGIVIYPDNLNIENINLDWSYDFGSNGTMELCALINAIKWINANVSDLKSLGITKVKIVSDSDYVVSGANYNLENWYKNKWRKRDGSPVRNVNFWKDYLTERRKCRINISINWQKGKSDAITKEVDKLAKKAAKSLPTKLNQRYIKPSVGKSLTGKDMQFEGDYNGFETEIIFRVYSHTPIPGRSMYRDVRFEIINDKKVIGKYRAYAKPEIDGLMDRHHYYRAKIDSKLGYPVIESAEEIIEPELSRIKAQKL